MLFRIPEEYSAFLRFRSTKEVGWHQHTLLYMKKTGQKYAYYSTH